MITPFAIRRSRSRIAAWTAVFAIAGAFLSTPALGTDVAVTAEGGLALVGESMKRVRAPEAVHDRAQSLTATEFDPDERTASTDYRIGPRDLLDIRVFELEELNASVRVSERGTISLPVIGELRVAGLTSQELEEELQRALNEYVNDPQVTVFITSYGSHRVSVVGAVRNPGVFEMAGTTTLLEALAQAGGVDQQNATGRVLVLRKQGEQRTLRFELQALMGEAAEEYNVELEAGDTINVVYKRPYTIYLSGQVRTPGSYQLEESITLMKAIMMAGGFADNAAKGRVQIIRTKTDGSDEILEVDVEEIMRGSRPDVPIQAEDVIVVPKTFF